MKIVDMKVHTVAIPTMCQLRHNTGVHPDLATAAKERKFFDGIVTEVAAFVDEFAKW